MRRLDRFRLERRRRVRRTGDGALAAVVERLSSEFAAALGTVSVADTLPAVLAAAAAWLLWRWTRSLPIAPFGALALSMAAAWVLS